MDPRLKTELNKLPTVAVADYLRKLFESESFDATISLQQFEELKTLSGLSSAKLRVALLPFAAAYSYAPVSNFCVGAIVRGLSGKLYFGANMEFMGTQIGQTVHAEQSGISHAWIKGENGVKDITINYSPCGHCRQFINELTTASTLKILLPDRDEKSLKEYLPNAFGPLDLGIKTRLMDKKQHAYYSDESEPLVIKAIEALNLSYAPYSKSFSGIALELDDNSIYLGAYAENAAFNPSMPPLQVALVQVLMAGKFFHQIKSVVLAELSDNQFCHLDGTRSTLERLKPSCLLNYITI